MTSQASDAHSATAAQAPPSPPAGADPPAPRVDGQPRSASTLEPLVEPLFRALWAASVISNVGTWMQNVGGTWLMTELTPSPVLVALMQTATSLPIFLAGLPAGALADLVDRRKLLLLAQTWMLIVAGALGGLTLVGLMNPWLLLAFTFALGLGSAFNAPAWQAIIPEVVRGRRMPAAVALESAGFNLARAVGPAAGGLIVAWIGPGANFMLNAASFLATIVVLYRWKRIRRTSHLPAERLLSATRAGLRYAQHAPELHAVLVRTVAFMLCASALWALLPLVARRELALPSSGYGALLASLGLGAVAAAGLLPRLRDRFSADLRVGGASLIFGLATLALGYIPNLVLLCAIMATAGVAWMVVTSGLNVMVQSCAPNWVKARALGTYLLVFQGTLAVGSLAWGFVAEHFGDTPTLTAAAAGLVVGVAATWRWPLGAAERVDLRPLQILPAPHVADAPAPEEGPVLVTAEYRVDVDKAGEFVFCMRQLGRVRRRDGAMRWGLFRDPAEAGRYVESFVLESWADYLRQVERTTLADRAIDAEARSFLADGDEPTVTHLVAAQAPDDAGPVTSGGS
ncbi:MAG: MFS transporter [Chloroflexi bacterium]|nr:MFS transporter [Chloroflexota bacterium]